MIRHL